MEDMLDKIITEENINKNHTIQTRVTNILREAILKRYLVGGQSIEITELTAKLNVSREPIRAALLNLQSEGLIQIETHKKPKITNLLPEEVRQICQVRCELEGLAIRQAIKKITNKDILYLNSLVEDMDATNSIDDYIFLNNKFHKSINEVCQNPVLEKFIITLRNNVERYLRLYVSNSDNIRLANQEHKKILEAIQRKDITKANELIKNHLTHTCEGVATVLENIGGYL